MSEITLPQAREEIGRLRWDASAAEQHGEGDYYRGRRIAFDEADALLSRVRPQPPEEVVRRLEEMRDDAARLEALPEHRECAGFGARRAALDEVVALVRQMTAPQPPANVRAIIDNLEELRLADYHFPGSTTWDLKSLIASVVKMLRAIEEPPPPAPQAELMEVVEEMWGVVRECDCTECTQVKGWVARLRAIAGMKEEK